MNLLAGASALGSVLNGASNLVKSLKQPRLSGEQFAQVLNRQIDMYRGGAMPSAQQALQAQATVAGDKFLALRDVDADARLKLEESGLDPVKFQAMDTDKDGYLSVLELRAYAAAQPGDALQTFK